MTVPQIFDTQTAAVERIGAHRGKGIPVLSLPFSTDGHGFNLWISIGTIEAGFYSPRHCHNFDQFRYMVSGSTTFEGWELGEGELAYFPESVEYGPQSQDADSTIITLQISGASGHLYPTREQVSEGNRRLRERDPEFGKGGVGRDAEGRERDSFEILWEELAQQPIHYAEPRYSNFVIMRPKSFDWVAEDGFERKKLGTFTEYSFEAEMVRPSSGVTIRARESDQSEIWVQTAGVARVEATDYSGLCFQFMPGQDEAITIEGSEEAEFLVFRLPKARSAN